MVRIAGAGLLRLAEGLRMGPWWRRWGRWTRPARRQRRLRARATTRIAYLSLQPNDRSLTPRGYRRRRLAIGKIEKVWVLSRPHSGLVVRCPVATPSDVGRSQPTVPRLSRSLRSEEHTSELQSRPHLVCRLLLEKKKTH